MEAFHTFEIQMVKVIRKQTLCQVEKMNGDGFLRLEERKWKGTGGIHLKKSLFGAVVLIHLFICKRFIYNIVSCMAIFFVVSFANMIIIIQICKRNFF